MGKLKDVIVPEDDWNHFRLSQFEYNYMKDLNSFIDQQQLHLQSMLVGFMKLIAIENGYSADDDLEFDIDFDNNDLQLKVRKVIK